jgi:multidrug resistance efflux pump
MEQAKKKKSKAWIAILLSLLLAGGAALGIFLINRAAGYLTTDNARVTTNQIIITSHTPGLLERFSLYEGQYVAQNEVLGWVHQGETMRSPVDGLVMSVDATQGQLVSPGEPLAVIADINNIRIVANIYETDIMQLQRGMAAIVTIDGLGNREFNGYISRIGGITSAELSGQAMFFNTGGNFTRVRQLLPIEITLTDDVNLDNLIGLNANVRIPLREQN